ncbi:MAG: ABC transporter [Sphingomonas sp. 28-66-16]|nr:MAG: ABC transporter [Sphingomonas sp. 28-66-16]
MSIAAGFRAELARLARTRFDLALLTLVPALLLASMAAMIFPGSLRALKVVVVDRDGGPLARQIIRNVRASPRLDLVGVTPQIGPALSAVRREAAQAVLVIPPAAGLLRDRQPIEILYQAQFLAAGSLASTYLELATADALARAAAQQAQLAGLEGVRRRVPGLHIRLLGNPTLSLEWYLGLLLGPGVLHLAIAVTAIGSAALLMEDGSFAAFARRTRAPATWLIGRMGPHVLAGTLWGALWFLWLTLARGYRLEGSLSIVVAALFLLFVATVAIALLLIAVTRETATALSGAVIVAGSALAYSGASLPINGAPWPAQLWSAILPLTHYLHLQMDETMGAALRPVLVEAGVLLLYPLLPGGLALWLMTRAGARR